MRFSNFLTITTALLASFVNSAPLTLTSNITFEIHKPIEIEEYVQSASFSANYIGNQDPKLNSFIVEDEDSVIPVFAQADAGLRAVHLEMATIRGCMKTMTVTTLEPIKNAKDSEFFDEFARCFKKAQCSELDNLDTYCILSKWPFRREIHG